MRLGVSLGLVAFGLVIQGCSGDGDNSNKDSQGTPSSTTRSISDYSDFKKLMSRYFREVYSVDYDFSADFDDSYEWIRTCSKTDPIVALFEQRVGSLTKDVKADLLRKTPRSDSIEPDIVELNRAAAIPALRFAAACRLLHMVYNASPKPISQMVEQARALMAGPKDHAFVKYPRLEELPSTIKALTAMYKYCDTLSGLPAGDRDACPGKCLNWLIGYTMLPVIAETVDGLPAGEFVNSLNFAYTGILGKNKQEQEEQVRPFARAMIMLENLVTASEFHVQESSLARGFDEVLPSLQKDEKTID
jgi:hypothetical protein